MKKLYTIFMVTFIFLSLSSCTTEQNRKSSSQAPQSSENLSQTSQVPSNQPIWKMDNFDSSKINSNIYYIRNHCIYKLNPQEDTFEYFTAMPSKDVCHIVIDKEEKYMYYSQEDRTDDLKLQYSFRKMNLNTKEVTIIDANLIAQGPFLYDKKIYFYADGYIMHYDTVKNSFKKYLSTYNIDGNGHIEIHNGSIYFFSCKLHQISLNDNGTKAFADKNPSYSYGKFYKNHLFYFNHENDKLKVIKQDIETEEKTILDELTVEEPDTQFESTNANPPYLMVTDDTIYYSYNHETYKIKTNGEGKKKFADFAICGDIFINNNKIYWIYSEGQDDGIGGPLEWDDYKLYSYDLITKERKEIFLP